MKLSLIGGLTFFLSFFCTVSLDAAPNFYYSYTDPCTADAREYIMKDKLFNVECTDEGSVTYWKPEIGGSTKEFATRGEIIYHFHFARNIKSGFLNMIIASFHWWYSEGHTYLYASSDGISWSKLAEAAPPKEGEATWGRYRGALPDTLLHKRDLYLKAVLYSYGEKAYLGGAYTNTAQHSRYQHGSDVLTFELAVEFDEWIDEDIFIETTFIDVNDKEITIDQLVPGESSNVTVFLRNPTEDNVNVRLSFDLTVQAGAGAGEIKTIGQSDNYMKAGATTTTTTEVQTPSDLTAYQGQLLVSLHDRSTEELLDTYERTVIFYHKRQKSLNAILFLLMSPINAEER